MLQRQHEADNLPYCHDHQVAFLAYSPMALGILSGKIGPIIAWTLQQKGCAHALVAGEVELTTDEIRIIRKVVDQTKL
jgi:aryl-alcohol dehydrogenase-like predicted oxidoreductase